MSIDLTWLAAVGVCVAGGILSWAAVAPSSQIFRTTVRLLGDASSIAQTFDDGPNPAITPELLDLLDRHQARASFFLIGRRVRAFPELVTEIAKRGHAIGNHTETQAALTFLSPRRIATEIDLCDEQSLRRGVRNQSGCGHLAVIEALCSTELSDCALEPL
jgi:peptidoglycan-N-acetylglucosamine deacetylase